MSTRIDVIATTVSGSISDWGKVERIEPLFAAHGFDDFTLHVVNSHAEAREQALRLLTAGRRLLISAGGSGTFNAVLEGCCEAKVPLDDIRLGFLRKGSADLIGKVLGMPDEIEAAVAVFAQSIRADHVIPCDVLSATSESGGALPRHFVGYGGAGIFGRIPHFTENRFMKWYKGVLSQLFGDLGPFTLGMALALLEKSLKGPFGRQSWRVFLNGQEVAAGRYQALIIVNGYLGPDLPYSDDDLGSGSFHLFALSDLGPRRLIGQVRHARNGSIMDNPAKWGMTHYEVKGTLRLEPLAGGTFPLNVDGSTLSCRDSAIVKRVDSIHLIARLAA
jgi:diacylglycerol kinase family enzyme